MEILKIIGNEKKKKKHILKFVAGLVLVLKEGNRAELAHHFGIGREGLLENKAVGACGEAALANVLKEAAVNEAGAVPGEGDTVQSHNEGVGPLASGNGEPEEPPVIVAGAGEGDGVGAIAEVVPGVVLREEIVVLRADVVGVGEPVSPLEVVGGPLGVGTAVNAASVVLLAHIAKVVTQLVPQDLGSAGQRGRGDRELTTETSVVGVVSNQGGEVTGVGASLPAGIAGSSRLGGVHTAELSAITVESKGSVEGSGVVANATLHALPKDCPLANGKVGFGLFFVVDLFQEKTKRKKRTMLNRGR